MDKKELNNLKFYIAEKERLLKELDYLNSNLKDGYSSIDFTYTRSGKVSANGIFNIAVHNIKYEKRIKKRIKRLGSIINKMYNIIEKINDPKVKTIVELRAIKGLKWEAISKEVAFDFTYCSRVYKNFIEN